MQRFIFASRFVLSPCGLSRVWLDVLRSLVFIIIFSARSWAQSLDGATLDLHRDGAVERYRLVAQNAQNEPTASQPAQNENAQNEPTAPASQPAQNENAQNEPNDNLGGFRVRFPSSMAPATVHVDATPIVLSPDHTPLNVKYEWDFGDPAGRHNTLSGFNAAHVYDTPGRYTIRLRITDSRNQSRLWSSNVNVLPDTRKIVQSDSVIFPLALALLDDDTTLLLKRGQRYDLSKTLAIRSDNIVIGAYGDGADPKLVWTGGAGATMISVGGTDISIENLTFTSNGTAPAAAIRLSGQNITIRNNDFLDVEDATNGNGRPTGVLLADNTATGTGGYFAWVNGTDYVIVGNVTQDIHQHVIRLNNFERATITDNVLNSTIRSAVSAQTGQYVWIGDNTLKGTILPGNGAVTSTLSIGPLGGADGIAQDAQASIRRTRYAVAEGNRLNTSQIQLQHGAEQVMVRDNVINLDAKSAIMVAGYDSTYQRTVSGAQIVNNTAINDDANGQFIKISGSAREITLSRNVYVAPNLKPGASSTAVVYVAGSDLSCFKYIGENIWPAVTPLAYAQGGVHYVWPKWSDAKGYRTPEEWRDLGAKDERYENVPAPKGND